MRKTQLYSNRWNHVIYDDTLPFKITGLIYLSSIKDRYRDYEQDAIQVGSRFPLH